jgi:hypothetical protein
MRPGVNLPKSRRGISQLLALRLEAARLSRDFIGFCLGARVCLRVTERHHPRRLPAF